MQVLEATGIEVLLCQADVAEVSQMEAVFAQVEARFGQVHGVIHAAGITTDAAFKTMQYLDLPACEVHFQPKVYGLLSLEQVVRVRPVDFCLVFSSLAAVLGGLSRLLMPPPMDIWMLLSTTAIRRRILPGSVSIGIPGSLRKIHRACPE